MAYEKLNLQDGATLTAKHLEHFEAGIAEAMSKAEAAGGASDEQVQAAVNTYLEANPVSGCPIRYVESVDTSNMVNLRDLETAPYVLYGYFSPFANSDMSLTFDNTIVVVARKAAGSHLLVLTGLNCKLNFLEILVDESAPGGHTFTRTDFNLLEMNKALLRGVPKVELLAANWQTEKEGKYYQTFDVAAVNTNCKISVGLDDEDIERMQDKVLTFDAKCVENGVVTVIAYGDKPTLDFTVQLTFQEVIWL